MWTIYLKQRKNSKIKETRDATYLYRNQLDKACFQHDMAYGGFKDLARRAASDKVLRDKAFNIAKNYYDGTQNYLVLRLIHRCFKRVAGFGSSNYIYFWKCKGLSDENITAPATVDYSLNPQLSHLNTKTRVKSKGTCLKQDKITYDHEKIVNIYIVYETSKNYDISSYPILGNCLFSAVTLTKTANIDKYRYSGYGIVFDRKGFFHTLVVDLVEM